VVCTNKEQALAYATKHLLLDDPAAARRLLKGLVMLPNALAGDAQMMRGLVDRKGQDLLEGLSRFLSWHDRDAEKPANLLDSKVFLGLPALGMAALGVHRALVTPEQLPSGNVHFPIELIVPIAA
jgi:hypothetical protein